MKANVLYNIGELRCTDIPKPILKSNEVLVKVRAAGICGSDVARVFKTGTYSFPTIIGHEFSGEVCEVKEKGDSLWIGKRVSVFPLKPCFQCSNCKRGTYELCANYDYLGSRCDGGFAEYVAVPIWNLLEIPDTVDFETAAMMEPASVAMHALRQSNFKKGDTVAVIGPGTIGMILCRLLLLFGAKKVWLIGRSQVKLDFAQKYGIKDTFNSTLSDAAQWIQEQAEGDGIDIVFEGTGAPASLNMGLDIVKSSGEIIALGNPISDMVLNKKSYWKLLRKQLHICGTWNSRFGTSDNDWNGVMSLLKTRELDLSSLITHRLSLDELLTGLNIMRDNTIYSNKVMIINDEK